MKGLGEFELTVMAAVVHAGEEAYGAAIQREIEHRSGRSAAVGAIYATLSRLEKKGYVESWLGEPTSVRGGRAKRYYRLTADGRGALLATVESLHRMVDGIGPDPILELSGLTAVMGVS